MKLNIRALLIFAAVGTTQAMACDCSGKLDDRSADLIFEGTAQEPLRWSQMPPDKNLEYVRVRFASVEVTKGPKRRSFLVDTTNTDCGFPFKKGAKYKVYAQWYRGPETEWLVDVCSDTKEIVTDARK